MKNLIFIVLLSLSIITIKAQTGEKECKVSFATTIGSGLSVSAPSKTPFTWQVLGYYNLTDRWSVGAGTGLSYYEKMLVPVFGDVKFQVGRTRRFTPYAELGMGYAFAPDKHVNGGFFMNPSFGIQYPLKNSMKLQFAVGYEIQKLERLKKHADDYFTKEFEEKLNHHSISLKLGFLF